MCGIPNSFKFQVVSAVLVHLRVYANFHDPQNKHGRFDRGNGQYLDPPSLTINTLGSGQTDIFEYFALS
jgi:hypothetical protein